MKLAFLSISRFLPVQTSVTLVTDPLLHGPFVFVDEAEFCQFKDQWLWAQNPICMELAFLSIKQISASSEVSDSGHTSISAWNLYSCPWSWFLPVQRSVTYLHGSCILVHKADFRQFNLATHLFLHGTCILVHETDFCQFRDQWLWSQNPICMELAFLSIKQISASSEVSDFDHTSISAWNLYSCPWSWSLPVQRSVTLVTESYLHGTCILVHKADFCQFRGQWLWLQAPFCIELSFLSMRLNSASSSISDFGHRILFAWNLHSCP